MSGVTPYGFVKMRLPEIRRAIADDLKNRLMAAGLDGNIETRPDSVLGMLIDTFAEREAALWENAEAVYNAMYPQTAVGVSLDRAVSLAGVARLGAQKAYTRLIFWGAKGTVVPKGAQASAENGSLWATDEAVNISANAAAGLVLQAAGDEVGLTCNGVAYRADKLAGLAAKFEGSGLLANYDGANLTLTAQDGVNRRFGDFVGLQVLEIGAAVAATASDNEATAAAGEINRLVEPVANRVSNPMAASAGRAVETDAELAYRHGMAVYRLGRATLPALAANIRADVPQIREIGVFANSGDTVDAYGRLPHSVHVVADGGDVEAIARAIWAYKAAGIDTHGAIVQEVQTEFGRQTVRFDRIAPVYVWIKAQITLLPETEQAFPAAGFAQIRESLLQASALFGLGDDVLYQKLYYAVFRTAGVATVDLKIARSAKPTEKPADGAFQAANLTIDPFAKAYFDMARIEVS
nr:baseplate J/gp47 family protein [uncultured Kingella sp.]